MPNSAAAAAPPGQVFEFRGFLGRFQCKKGEFGAQHYEVSSASIFLLAKLAPRAQTLRRGAPEWCWQLQQFFSFSSTTPGGFSVKKNEESNPGPGPK